MSLNKIIRKLFNTFLENRILSRWFVLIIDLFIIAFATIISYLLTLQIYRNIGSITHPDLIIYLTITIFFNLVFFLLLKTYKGIVRYSTIYELQRILMSLLFADAFIFVVLYKFVSPSGSVSVAYCSTLFLMSMTGLYGFRIIVVTAYRRLVQQYGQKQSIPVFIWRIDEDNIALSQLLNLGKGKFIIKGFIEDNQNTKFKKLTNLPVLFINNYKDLTKYNINGILFSSEEEMKNQTELVEKLIGMNINIYVTQQMNINNLSQLSDIVNHIRPIQIEDLLGRPEINISTDSISSNIKGKTVLITGAAGSIGSEIVHQLTKFAPKCLVCFDQAETPLNELDLNLAKRYEGLNYISIIGDVRSYNKLSLIFERYKPDIVYHAAAYKHVPIMERDPAEAIITNVEGTKNLVDLSIEHNVEMFVMVSTDKAVNPTNVMGASKRLAEIYVQSCANDLIKNKSNTKFVTTRFGNVLGSNGSVIPLFRKQIESGGPITVTDPEITRYFMTIPEACRLVLEASVIGKSGYIYVFDMGTPVKIAELAHRMITLAGLVPGKDIEIVYTGLRPGEKLYEELLNDAEKTENTSHQKIMIAKVREYDFEEVWPLMKRLIELAHREMELDLVKLMKEIIPEYISKNSKFEELDQIESKMISL